MLESNRFFAPQIGFQDEQIDTLFAQGRADPDADKRKVIYKQIEERVLDLVPWTYLVRREQAEAARSYVKGYEHIPVVWTSVTLRETWLDK
jgi:peptide/nickel transport system substrate-binding protein